MNFSRLFIDAWHLVRRSRLLLAFGFASSASGSAFGVVRIWLSANLSGRVAESGGDLGSSDLFSSLFHGISLIPPLPVLRTWFVWGALAFVFLIVGFWLLSLLVEAAQIRAVLMLRGGQTVTLRQALQLGRRFVPRFVGVDTLIFLPLFLLALLAMVLVLGILVGALTLTLSDASSAASVPILAFAAICLLPVACLVVPVGFCTTMLRTFTFRDSVLRNSGVRDSIRHTWMVTKSSAGKVFVLIALVWGTRYMISFVLSLVMIPAFGAFSLSALVASGADSPSSGGVVSWVTGIGLAGLTIIVNGVIAALTATIWTLGYDELSAPRAMNRDDTND